MVAPVPDVGRGEEPAFTKGTITGLITAAIMFAVVRFDRSVDILTDGEIDTLQNIMVLAAPIFAAFLIRRLVTPTSQVEAMVQQSHDLAVHEGEVVAQKVEVAVQEAIIKKEEEVAVFFQAAADEAGRAK